MANVFDDVLPTAIDLFWQQVTSKSLDWNAVARIRTDAVASLKLAELRTGGSAGFGAWSGGSVTPTDIIGVPGTPHSSVAYKKQVVISRYDAEDNPLVVSDIASKLAQDASYKLGSLVWAAVGAASTTDHPTISGKKICDSHAFGTNKGTGALSASTLNAARVAMRSYRNHDGDIIPFEGFKLLVPNGLETMGKQLTRSLSYPNAPTNGGESDLINTFLGMDSGLSDVLVCPQLSDANDWALVCTASDARKPFDMWIRSPIELISAIDPSTGALIFNCQFRAQVLAKPDCDTGIYYSAFSA